MNNKKLPEEFKKQVDTLIKDLHPNAYITTCMIKVHGSILNSLNLDSKTSFGGKKITKNNIYTSGKMYEKFSKLFNIIYENSTDIRSVKIDLIKTPQSWVDRYYGRYNITPEKEHFYYNYIICATFEGETEEFRLAEEKYRKKRELAEQEARARHERSIKHIAYYKELNKNEHYEDLGCANGWGDDVPELVKQADKDNDCFYERENLGRCYNKYICHKYKFYYTVDSSD